jgi:hypothetical protein
MFGTVDGTLLFTMLSARLSPEGDPIRTSGDFLQIFGRIFSGRKASRTREDFGLPAKQAGRADPPVDGKLWRPVNRALRRRAGAGERRVTLSPQGIVFSRTHPPAADEPDPAAYRRVHAYPLLAEAPGAYYVLSGAAAGRRLTGHMES